MRPVGPLFAHAAPLGLSRPLSATSLHQAAWEGRLTDSLTTPSVTVARRGSDQVEDMPAELDVADGTPKQQYQFAILLD